MNWTLMYMYLKNGVIGYCHIIAATHLVRWGKATSALVCTWMGDRCGMTISADSPSDETLNLGPLALLLRRQYELSFIVQFSFFSIFNPALTSKTVTQVGVLG